MTTTTIAASSGSTRAFPRRKPDRAPTPPRPPVRIMTNSPTGSPSDLRPTEPLLLIERIVHEAMLTWRMMLDRDANYRSRSCWPDYAHERDEQGNRPSLSDLRPMVAPWKPTPRHVTEADWVMLECYGTWPNPRSKRFGLENWQWLLLELRAWQVVYDWKGGWREIASTINSRPHMPKFSHEWVRLEHRRLIKIAFDRARQAGLL